MVLLKNILLRFGLLILIAILGYVCWPLFNFINVSVLQFHVGNAFGTYALIGYATILGWVFWGSVIFGALGKIVDYVLFTLIFCLALWLYISTNSTPMYVGLIGVAATGNIIGYVLKLKLGWQKWKSQD